MPTFNLFYIEPAGNVESPWGELVAVTGMSHPAHQEVVLEQLKRICERR